MIGIPLGLLYGNATEWAIHKYVLHGLGKNKKHFFSFHWHDHHKNCRKHQNYDPDYTGPQLRWHAPGKELFALSVLSLVHAPLFPIAPFFTGTIFYCSANYYFKHKRAHLDPQWGKTHLRWHWDHHQGKNQDANWCVTHPFFDHVMGTRIYSSQPESTKENKMLSARLGSLLNRFLGAQGRVQLFAQTARQK